MCILTAATYCSLRCYEDPIKMTQVKSLNFMVMVTRKDIDDGRTIHSIPHMAGDFLWEKNWGLKLEWHGKPVHNAENPDQDF
jgi:formylmethanofuran--tetrahydromethanopterin N-formyltransferase